MTAIYPVAFIDAPQVLKTNITNIPGSGSLPLQVVANIGFKPAYALDYMDTTGDFIGVFIGQSGSEQLVGIIGNGQTERAWIVIAAGQRVSLRSMTTTAITDGNLTISFMGFGSLTGVLP